MRNLALKRVAMCTLATAALCAYSTTNYWDNNGSTAGFGTAGGTLNLASPASSLVLNNTSNTINTVLTGASGIQVHTDNYRLTHKSYLTTTPEIIFTDAILADYRAASGVMGGSFIGANLTLQADAYHFVNDGTTVTFQLQVDDKDFIKCVKVGLKQSGADITALAVYAKNISSITQPLGYNFDLGGNVTTVATSGTVKA